MQTTLYFHFLVYLKLRVFPSNNQCHLLALETYFTNKYKEGLLLVTRIHLFWNVMYCINNYVALCIVLHLSKKHGFNKGMEGRFNVPRVGTRTHNFYVTLGNHAVGGLHVRTSEMVSLAASLALPLMANKSPILLLVISMSSSDSFQLCLDAC